MQKIPQISSSQPVLRDGILTIPQEVFRAMHPMDQAAAQALQVIGKARILPQDPAATG